jgi:hypothetical protein
VQAQRTEFPEASCDSNRSIYKQPRGFETQNVERVGFWMSTGGRGVEPPASNAPIFRMQRIGRLPAWP